MSYHPNSGVQNLSMNQISSFEKAVMLNIKQSIQKHLSHMKIEQQQLNYSLFLSISNYRTDQHTDECFLMLLRHKANPNYEINDLTPLIAACQKGHLSLVKLLLQYGAKPDLSNKKNQVPLEIVLFDKRENYDVAQALINALPTVNVEIKEKMPIVIAVERQFFRIYQMLIEKGASLIFETQNIMHIIMRKKFKKIGTKKKFLKELAGRSFLIHQDQNNKLPFDYEESQEIKNYCFEIFKPKVVPKIEILASKKMEKFKQNSRPLSNSKQSEQIPKQKELTKRKSKEQLDISFSEFDEEELNEDKMHIGHEEKLTQVIESIDEEEKCQEHQKIEEKKKQVKQENIEEINICKNQKLFEEEGEKEILKSSFQQNKLNKQEQNEEGYKIEANIKKIRQKQLDGVGKKSIIRENKKSKKPILEQKKKKKLVNEKSYEEKQKKIKKDVLIVKESQKEKNISVNQILQQNIKEEANDLSEFSDFSEEQECNITYLNKQILQFAEQLNKKNQKNEPAIQQTLKILEEQIRNSVQKLLQLKVHIEIIVYGSRSTGLAIANSDVDILILTNLDSTYLMKVLEQNKILEFMDVTSTKFIYSASMPVIKLKMGKKHNFLMVDITFPLKNHTGVRCSQIVKQFIVMFPILKPLVLFLKTLVSEYALSDPYTGGIGSYSIILMAIAMLQCTHLEKNEDNLANILLQFFYFYGQELDYISQAIIVYPPGYHQYPVYSIYQLPLSSAPSSSQNLIPKLIIYDPLNPVNNVSRSSYRICDIKKLFCICYVRLKMGANLQDLLDGAFIEVVHDLGVD